MNIPDLNVPRKGQVLYDVWGYSMRIVDWYCIVEVTEKTVVVQPMVAKETSTGFLCGTSVPLYRKEDAPKSRLRIKKSTIGYDLSTFYKGKVTNATGTKSSITHYLYPWDGVTPKHFDHCD